MKRRFKIILDIVMFLAALTLFSKQFISMEYHEIAGLVLTGLFIIHIAVNFKTMVGMAKKFIRIPTALKVGLIVDILLVVCFAIVAVSGILISHTILTSISSGNTVFKMLHMFSGGLSVILLGIHIGLHICRKPIPTAAAIIASVLVLCAGVYGAVNSGELRWLSMPFTAAAQSEGGGIRPGTALNPGSGANQSDAGQGKGMHNGQGKENSGVQGMTEGRQKGNAASMPLSQKIETVIMFLGMILTCTMITYWIFVPKKKSAQQ
ncbi:MAG: DUF4405 domain-containing protein [Monoglobaceae bacterium]